MQQSLRQLSAVFPLFFCMNLVIGQVNFTARDQVTPYTGRFRAGINMGYYPGWSNQELANISAGNAAIGQKGIGARTTRQSLPEIALDFYGYDLLAPDFVHFSSVGMGEYVALVGAPAPQHQDYAQHCPGVFSNMFANLYLPIWDGGANGTPYNDDNYFAAYMFKVVSKYKDQVRFWEIWNEPGLDLTGNLGWRGPDYPGNWWTADPNPCDIILHAPVEQYVRTLRIAWEIIKTVAPEDYVCLGSVGYFSMMDAVCRNTDNPNGGAVSPEFPFGGAAYFDCVIYHAYPHFDGSTTNFDAGFFERHSDVAAEGLIKFRDNYQNVLTNYGYDGVQFPKKEWVVTEVNAPRKAFTGTYFAGDLQQINYVPKVFITAKINKVHQLHFYQLVDQQTDAAANYEFHLMGMYKKFDNTLPYNQQVNNEGKVLKTVSDLITNSDYDAAQTAAMNVPANARGYAFKRNDGSFVYALWAYTTEDLSEQASASYSFPGGLGLVDLVKYNWDWSYSGQTSIVSSQNIQLDATPVFFTKSTGTNSCDISAVVNNIVCNNNNTPDNSADDTWTFSMTTTGVNTSAGWNSTGSLITTGGYNTPINFGPYLISAGNVYFVLHDNAAFGCSFEVEALAPASCSSGGTGGSCAVNLLTNNGFENGNNNWDASGQIEVVADAQAGTQAVKMCSGTARIYQTKAAQAGKTYTFRAQTKRTGDLQNGSTISLKFMSLAWQPLQTDFAGIPNSANYGEISLTKTAPANTAWVEVSINKEPGTVCVFADETCLSEGGSGGGGGNPCSISAAISGIVCDNNGTPTDAADDHFSFNLTVNGANTGSGWSATIGGQAISGIYGAALNLTDFPISGGNLDFKIFDNTTATCFTAASVLAPAPCSTGGGGGGGGTPNCASKGDFPWHEWISEVKIGAFSKTSDKGQYSDFTNPPINVLKGVAIPVSVKVNWSWATADEYVVAWVDLNQNSIFDEPTETLFSQLIANPGNGSAPKLASGMILIPASAAAGTAKIRIALKRGGLPTPCETIPFGEVEDYSLAIPTLFTNSPVVYNSYEKPAAGVSNDFDIYPNPTDGGATLRLTDFIGKQVSLAIFNQQGKKVHELRFEELATPFVDINLADEASGQFFIHLVADGMRPVSKKIMLLKSF